MRRNDQANDRRTSEARLFETRRQRRGVICICVSSLIRALCIPIAAGCLTCVGSIPRRLDHGNSSLAAWETVSRNFDKRHAPDMVCACVHICTLDRLFMLTCVCRSSPRSFLRRVCHWSCRGCCVALRKQGAVCLVAGLTYDVAVFKMIVFVADANGVVVDVWLLFLLLLMSRLLLSQWPSSWLMILMRLAFVVCARVCRELIVNEGIVVDGCVAAGVCGLRC